MVTSKNVAEVAGVSRATVSNVINRSGFVSEELKKRVLNAIKELNYIPNEVARSLKTKYTNTIGVVIPNITSPVFAYCVKGIEEYVDLRGYKIILCNTDENHKKERKIIEILLQKNIDGLIIIPSGDKNKEYIQNIINIYEKPIVLLDRKIDDLNVDIVVADNKKASYIATKQLIDYGYKHIATITHKIGTSLGKERLEGYKKALTDNNIKIKKEYIEECDPTQEDGYSKIKILMNNSKVQPDSLVVSSTHLTLIGIIQYLKENNFKIPDDIGLISFDDLPWVKFLNPSITVIKLDMYSMGKKAAEILLNRIKKNDPAIKKTVNVFETELIIRDSIKKIK